MIKEYRISWPYGVEIDLGHVSVVSKTFVVVDAIHMTLQIRMSFTSKAA